MDIGASLSCRVAVETGLSLTALCYSIALWGQFDHQARCLKTQGLRKAMALKTFLDGRDARECWIMGMGQLMIGDGSRGKAKRQRSRWASSKQREVFGQLVLVLANLQTPRATEQWPSSPDIEACLGEGQRRSMWPPPICPHSPPTTYSPRDLEFLLNLMDHFQ